MVLYLCFLVKICIWTIILITWFYLWISISSSLCQTNRAPEILLMNIIGLVTFIRSLTSVSRLVGRSVSHSFLKGREVTLPCSYGSTLNGSLNHHITVSSVKENKLFVRLTIVCLHPQVMRVSVCPLKHS